MEVFSKMTDINSLYLKTCALSVFRGVRDTALFGCFEDFANACNIKEKRLAYGALVGEIYKDGASLAECLRRIVFEDENVFVKAIGTKRAIPEVVARAAEHELSVLSELASLTPEDFFEGMGQLKDESLPEFYSESVDLVTEYRRRTASIERYGYGIFSSHGMFSVSDDGDIVPVLSADSISIDSFVGYREERQKVLDNTKNFLEGKPSANILLYGDAGTGKSSTVKAVANHYFDDGLRLIEIRKDQLLLLSKVMGRISDNPLKFIIFIDDLSFNGSDDDFSMLKATLEGSACAKASNAVIYATSNRRHIVRESFADRDGGDVHRNDTLMETMSLSERFGLTVLFSKPDKKLYLEIVKELAARRRIEIPTSELETRAEAFALKRGHRSARCAEQFVDGLC